MVGYWIYLNDRLVVEYFRPLGVVLSSNRPFAFYAPLNIVLKHRPRGLKHYILHCLENYNLKTA